jgi:hypothetical protein
LGYLRQYTVRTAYSRRIQYRALRAMLSSFALVLVSALVVRFLG